MRAALLGRVCFLCCAVLALNAGAQPRRIAVLTDLSGVMAYQGRQTRLGAELAAEELRANGAAVELLIEDHQLQTKAAVSLVQKVLAVDRVEALFIEFTPTAVAAAPAAERAKVLFIYSGGARSILKNYPQAFKTHIDFYEGCRRLAEVWRQRGLTRVGVLTANIESAQLCTGGARSVYPDLHEAVYTPGDDVSTPVLLFKRRSYAALLNVGYEADQIRMFKALTALQYQPRLGSLDNNFSRETLKEWRQVVQHLDLFGFAEISPEFRARVLAREPRNTLAALSSAAIAYTHVKQLARALERCLPRDLACQAKSVEQSGPDSAGGFLGWRDHVAQFALRIASAQGEYP